MAAAVEGEVGVDPEEGVGAEDREVRPQFAASQSISPR